MSARTKDAGPAGPWHELVTEAESHSGVSLNEELESYLVFLLMRFTTRTEMASAVLALEYLEGMHEVGQLRQDRMRDVGDQCLLYSGLFPKRAERRRVRISYYVDLGRSAYHHLASHTQAALSELFAQLAEEFVPVMDTLQAMRALNPDSDPLLSPLQALELWQQTGSRQAKRVFEEKTGGAVPFAVSTGERVLN